jgi:hypothetical protein
MGERRGAYRVLVGNQREGDTLKDRGVDDRIILKWIFEMWNGDMDWIGRFQERDRWRAVLNTVMNLRVP